jgi:tetratricopeptide (TPR) repeat protein
MRNISRLAITVAFGAGIIYAQGFSVAGANAFRSRQDWNGLLQYCQQWTRSQPNEAMGWYYLGSTYGLGFKQPANAVAPFQKAVQLKPDWALVWNALGFTYMDLKRYDDAAGAFRKCVEFEPSKANYWNSLASAYSWANKPRTAFETLESQQKSAGRPATNIDWYNMGNSYANLGIADGAKGAYQQALAMNPRHAEAWNNLGVAEQVTGNNANALQDYQRSASLGDSLATGNLAKLRAALASASRSSGGGGYNPRATIEAVHQMQVHGWDNNHPGNPNNPYK